VTFKISNSSIFDKIILVCIIINSIILLIKYYNQSDTESSIFETINLAFTIIFSLEAILKIVGNGAGYFKSGWNIFDFFVVILSLLGIVVSATTTVNLGS
jgi:voltage-dependent calcium channel L type alpha-1S